MESFLLVIAIVLLVLDIDERHESRRSGVDQTWEEAGRAESRVRNVTDRAVLAMMNEVRRAQVKQL